MLSRGMPAISWLNATILALGSPADQIAVPTMQVAKSRRGPLCVSIETAATFRCMAPKICQLFRAHLDNNWVIVKCLCSGELVCKRKCEACALSENHTTRPITQWDTYQMFDREG